MAGDSCDQVGSQGRRGFYAKVGATVGCFFHRVAPRDGGGRWLECSAERIRFVRIFRTVFRLEKCNTKQ